VFFTRKHIHGKGREMYEKLYTAGKGKKLSNRIRSANHESSRLLAQLKDGKIISPKKVVSWI
jgi:hypothetical protein